MSINDLTPTPSQDDPKAVSQSNDDTATDLQMPDELTVLKQRARLMGLNFSNNIGLEALKKKIEEHQAAQETDSDVPATGAVDGQEAGAKVNPLVQSDEAPAPVVKAKPKSLRQVLVEQQMKLVRVRIQNLDDKKKNLPGEIFTVANEYIGTVRKFIPYGDASDNGYHIPYCLYTFLKDKMFLSIRTGKDRKTGTPTVQSRWAREFALEILPPLTAEELHKLGQAQIAAGSTSGDSAL
ncbi:hypothetical protein Axy04_060 [Achromobacter phage vB_AxyP_19-32_Axy04]|uniref:Uncharacterized protein n=1 Tax=Achromobacter phage vB_AxyP_19-32_Axy04 TaxID=2591039 RepID=A0A514CTG6_9CAUD|nr:hypothetical protein KMC55_gp54 [Achromobacter phage vB_AxyP_19-32_Axy04]QDH83754.1 hypothetical protein Axy04_060 [Achromobacter phage vB_AxyP_19-32_Axy04]